MSEFMESTGKTVDEAIREALLRMGLRREEVEVTVVQRDRGARRTEAWRRTWYRQ